MATTKNATLIETLEREVRDLERVEVHVETNQGTYGAAEAGRKVGTGDPAHANREVYETVGGKRRETGPDEADAPGRMRQIGRTTLAELRKRLADLKARLRAGRGRGNSCHSRRTAGVERVRRRVMPRDVVVFERDERFTDTGRPELDFRLVRCALPDGSCPLAIADRPGFAVACGQWFSEAEVAAFAERVSGYSCSPTEAVTTP